MDKDKLVSWIATLVSLLIGAGLAWSAGQGGMLMGTTPIVYIATGLAFAVQFIVFIPAYIYSTEKYYDLTGSLTYMGVTLFTLYASGPTDLRSYLIACCIIIWATRLGTYLFIRVMKAGHDKRFETLKSSFPRFLMTWTMQGLWVTFSCMAGITAMASANKHPADIFLVTGALLWIMGFAIEAIADSQKNSFRRESQNKDKFINRGLWSWSRHPNYFGEIVLWTGIAIMAFPALRGWQYVTLISPLFVTLLLTKISGIPLLEEAGNKKWGHLPEYKAYTLNTSVLVPMPPKK